MLRAHYICMSLATVIWECSLNQFSTLLFVSLFVNREPQQIFMGDNTEYRANLVKAKVNFRLNYRIPGHLNNMILYFFPRHPTVFFVSSWEDLISLTTFTYRHKLTWQVDARRCKKLHATVWQKLITVAEGKAKIEMSPFSWL